KETWLKEYVKRHFEGLESISFSALTDDAYEYLKSEILNIRVFSEVMGMGSEVHRIAEKIIKKEEYELAAELKPYKANIERLVNQIHEQYPLDVAVEENITVPLSKLMQTDVSLDFSGKIDAVFKNNNSDFLIVDWKTSKNTDYGSSHRQQLSVYQKAYAIKHGVSLNKIKVAIGYVGLRKTIDDGKIDAELDLKQPASSAFETFSKRLNTFLSWKKDVDVFFKELSEVKEDDPLLRSIIEQYRVETT
ncbi:MAG: PD-(D/E)XK nuclease family protein, partial [Thermoplasmata archaeon]|nr:PD-(D/E)XK nuclease family protein [Thermoplasmata archaeon]